MRHDTRGRTKYIHSQGRKLLQLDKKLRPRIIKYNFGVLWYDRDAKWSFVGAGVLAAFVTTGKYIGYIFLPPSIVPLVKEGLQLIFLALIRRFKFRKDITCLDINGTWTCHTYVCTCV